MEKVLDGEHGVSGLLAGLIVVLCLHLLTKLGHFIWEFFNKKQEVTEDAIKNLTSVLSANTAATHSLEERLRVIDDELKELSKFKIDVRLLISAIKELAGDKWPDIRKIIIEDKFPT